MYLQKKKGNRDGTYFDDNNCPDNSLHLSVNKMIDTVSFISIGSLSAWGGTVYTLDGNRNFPFVYKDSLFNYFAWDGQRYNLVMQSVKDLNEEK